jgi:hypothetical protein
MRWRQHIDILLGFIFFMFFLMNCLKIILLQKHFPLDFFPLFLSFLNMQTQKFFHLISGLIQGSFQVLFGHEEGKFIAWRGDLFERRVFLKLFGIEGALKGLKNFGMGSISVHR